MMTRARSALFHLAMTGLLLTLAACDQGGALLAGEDSLFAQPQLPKISAWSGQMSKAESLQYYTAHDDQSWRKLWQLIGQDPPLPSLPTDYMAVAIFMGQEPTTGYAVRIKDISDNWQPGLPDTMSVHFLVTTPPKINGPPPQLTSPWTVRLVPAQSFDPIFVRG